LPAGLFAETDASWLVVLVATGATTGERPLARVHYLVSPKGARYELPGLGDVSLLQWLPGTPNAMAITSGSAGSVEVEVVNLETGRRVGGLDWEALHQVLPTATSLEVALVGDETTDMIVSLGAVDDMRALRVAADGTVRASSDSLGSPPVAAPGGRRFLATERGSAHQLVEVDPDTLKVIGHALDSSLCSPSWVDDTHWIANCLKVGAAGESVTFLAGPGGVSPLGLDGWVRPLLTVGDGSVLLAVEGQAGDDGATPVDGRVVAVRNAAVEDVATGLAFVSGATSVALVGNTAGRVLAVWGPDDQWGIGLTAPVLAWQPGAESTTPLVPAGQGGAATVFPVGTTTSTNARLLVRDDGRVELAFPGE
jgi:hypothetical protein